MLQRQSAWSTLLLSSAVLTASTFLAPPSWAQETTPATPAESAPAAPTVDPKLKALADDFMHYSIVGNTLLAKDSGQALLDLNPDSKDFLAAFEAAANGRDFRTIMLRNQRQADLKEVSKKLADKLEDGYRATARNPDRIKADIKRLAESPRAYANAKEHLIAAGPYAAQYYFAVLNDESQKNLQPYVIRLMTEIGKPVLAPMLQQLKTPQVGEKVTLINIVGQIGYPQSLPYLKAILADTKNVPEVIKATQDAVNRIDPSAQHAAETPSEAFYKLANQYYQNRGSLAAAYPDEPTNPHFFYDPKLDNVVAVPVTTPICQYIQAMRASEASLALQPNDKERGPAISLWLASDIQRELHLGAAKDPTRPDNTPDASYYSLAAGPIYVNSVLQMALDSHDSALALKTIPILEATGGTQGLVSPQAGNTPLVQALAYPDRAVRFGAAFALARANPTKTYPDYFRVVPVLTEAIGQTGAPAALLVEPNQENRNRLKGILAAMTPAYNVIDGPTLSEALNNSRKVPAFDLVLIPAGSDVTRIQELGRTDYRLTTAPTLVLADKAQLPNLHAQFVGQKGLQEIDTASDDKALAAALDALRAQLGQTAVDPAAATAFATTSLKILNTLAVDHASIYNVKEAIPTLIDTLKDKRAEVLIAAANILGQLDTPEGQKALANSALADGVDAPTRQALLVALAESAKHAGNTLDSDTIAKLIKEVATESDANVRTAAATALGALNVQTNQAAKLILDQAK